MFHTTLLNTTVTGGRSVGVIKGEKTATRDSLTMGIRETTQIKTKKNLPVVLASVS